MRIVRSGTENHNAQGREGRATPFDFPPSSARQVGATTSPLPSRIQSFSFAASATNTEGVPFPAAGRTGHGCCFSSGNDGGSVPFPSNVACVVIVGAINKSGALWSPINRGPEMDVVAPRGNAGSSVGNVATLDLDGANGANSTNYLTALGGTSAAAPQVEGVATLILSLIHFHGVKAR